MKKILLSTVAMGSVIAASSAFAADLPSRKSVPTLASKSIWQGAYAGINAGYGVNNINNYSNETGFYPIKNETTGDFTSIAGYIAGGVAGAQLGYNHVFANHIMTGAEIDLDWADIYNNASPLQAQSLSIGSNQTASFSNDYNRTGLDWIGTARARIGYDLGRFLPYVTGGLAYGELSQSSNGDSISQSRWSTTRGNSSTVSVGWAAGAGAEYMVADNWSVKGEYLFTSIGGISTPVQAAIGNKTQGATYLASRTDYTGSFGVHQIRAGLNYHPSWWGATPIIGDYGIASSSPLAATLPSHKSMPMLTSTSLWKGIYAGINAGYGVNNINNYSNSTGFYPTENLTGGTFNSTAGYVAGGVAGAQLGYNHVFANRIMAGAEIDLDWADIYNNTARNIENKPNQRQTLSIGSDQSAYLESNYNRTGLDWIGTARARIGYDLGRFLPYVTGGLAYGGLSQSNNYNFFDTSAWSTTRGNSSTVSVGWAAGAGAEYMVADNWSVKGEYLFTSIGGISTPVQSVSGSNSQGTTYLASQTDYTGSFGVHQIRAGLNYHPSWWGATPIIGDYGIASSSPLAATLPSHKSMPMLTSTSLWKGIYAGINAGYGVNNINNYSNSTGFSPASNKTNGIFSSTADYIAGGLAGAQLGYNHVFANRIMAGAEIDLDWADIYNNAYPIQKQFRDALSDSVIKGADSINYYNRTGLDWIGTARARIGYDLGRFLPYITGGLAYGGLSQSVDNNSFNYYFSSNDPSLFSRPWSTTRGNSSTVSVGWVAGAGAEYMVADNWSIKGEYLFTSIGGISTPVQSASGDKTQGATYLASRTDYTGSFGVHQVRAGLNYHPSWWGAAPVISAY